MELCGGPDGFVSDIVLALEAVDKRFGGTTALTKASLTVRRGTLHAVLGENGAGKTTLMRIAFGMQRPDAGVIRLDGRAVRLASSADAMARGLGMVHQHFTLVPAMTAAENIALGGRGMFSRRTVDARVASLAERAGLPVDPAARVSTLGVGAQQRVEILKALARNARILILDEPTAVLTPSEIEELFTWLRRFVAGGGTTVLITHKLTEALTLADDITVLRRGRDVLSAPAAGLTVNRLVDAVTGDSDGVDTPGLRVTRTPGQIVARLEAAEVRDARGVVRVQPVTVALRAGEIVGVAGVEGSGASDLLRLLAGRLAPSHGIAHLPRHVGFAPEDRHRDALIEEFTLTENFALRDASQRMGVMPWKTLRAQAERVMHAHDVRAPTPDVAASTLSGGNQQKFVLGRELDDRPLLVVADNPVRGLDIRASAHVLRELRETAAAGSAVVIHSSDLDDVLPLADRMLVMFAGRLSEVAVTRDAVARAMIGAA